MLQEMKKVFILAEPPQGTLPPIDKGFWTATAIDEDGKYIHSHAGSGYYDAIGWLKYHKQNELKDYEQVIIKGEDYHTAKQGKDLIGTLDKIYTGLKQAIDNFNSYEDG